MPHFKTEKIILHKSRHMFDLVADIERYPEFVPLCESLIIRSRLPKGDATILTADMTVGYKFFHETVTSQVSLYPAEERIDVSYLEGPFKYLQNYWVFTFLEERRCKINFFIDYEFKNKILELAAGAVFSRAFQQFSEAFENRANVIYGIHR